MNLKRQLFVAGVIIIALALASSYLTVAITGYDKAKTQRPRIQREYPHTWKPRNIQYCMDDEDDVLWDCIIAKGKYAMRRDDI